MDDNFNINPDVIERTTPPVARDPFADLWSDVAYVNDAARLNYNKLLHLVPYSEVLLVSGVPGIGKSTLLQQFVVGAKKSWKVIHIHASSLMSVEEFLREIVHGFGLPAAGVDSVDDMVVEIGRYLQALGRSGRRAIVVVDDLQLLADDVVITIENILGDSRSLNAVSLVVSVDDGSGLARLNNFPSLMKRLAYTLRLEPMDEAEVVAYIDHRLKCSGANALEPLFTEAAIKKIYSKSGGVPGKVNELARNYLNKKGGRQGAMAAAGSSGQSLVRWGAVLVGVAAIGTVLLFQDRINELVQPQGSPPLIVSEPPVVGVDVTGQAVDQVEPGVAVVDEAVVAGTEPPLNMGALAAQSEAGPENGAEPAVAEEVVPVVVAEEEAGLVAPLPTQEAAVTAPAKVAVAAVPAVKPTVAPQEKAAEKKVVEKGWLKSQNPEHFTLQLMALLDESQVTQFVKKNRLEGKSEIFSVTRKGNKLTALVYGSYPDRAAADAAASSLPKGWGIKGTWVRTFAAVVEDAGS